jgi:hypothetical protein
LEWDRTNSKRYAGGFDGLIPDTTQVKDEAFSAMFAPHGRETEARFLKHHRENGGISRVEKIADYYQEFFIYSARFRQSPKGVVFQEPWKPGMAS